MILAGSTVVLDLPYLVTSIRACFCCVVEKSELRKKLSASGDMFLISTRCDSSSFPFICAAILIRVRKSCELMHSIHPWVVVATKKEHDANGATRTRMDERRVRQPRLRAHIQRRTVICNCDCISPPSPPRCISPIPSDRLPPPRPPSPRLPPSQQPFRRPRSPRRPRRRKFARCVVRKTPRRS